MTTEPVVYGHRGASAVAPENTLAAFRALQESGVSAVELDVHRCATGEIVVAHDDDLSRTAGVDLRLRTSDLLAIREHDVGSWFAPEFADERVPLLSEVFDLLGSEFHYDIEIKYYGKETRPGVIETELAAMILARRLSEACIVSSFDPLVLHRFERLATGIRTALIYSPDLPFVLKNGRGRLVCRPDLLKPFHGAVDPALIAREHNRGLGVIPWTVDEPARALELAAMGVDGIITNDPEGIRETLARRN